MSFYHRFTGVFIVAVAVVACSGRPQAEATTASQIAGGSPTAVSAAPTATPLAGSPTSVQQPEPAATATPSPTVEQAQTEAETRASMQATADKVFAAYNESDPEKLLAAIDPKSLALKRTELSRLNATMESQFAGM